MKLLAIGTGSPRLKFERVTRSLMNSFVSSVKPDQMVEITMKKVSAKRSQKQLGAWWAVLMPAAKHALTEAGWDYMGVPLVEPQVKAILYHFCSAVGENDERVPLSEQTVEQAATFFENCRSWLAKNFHVVVPDPDPNWHKRISPQKPTEAKEGATRATDASHGLTDGDRGHGCPPVGNWGEENRLRPYGCTKCGCGYQVVPANKKCNNQDDDGFSCRGPVVRR